MFTFHLNWVLHSLKTKLVTQFFNQLRSKSFSERNDSLFFLDLKSNQSK